MSRTSLKLILLILLIPVICLSQDNDICADCHTDSGGDPVEVSTASLMGSAHEDFDCVDCHYMEDPEDHAEDLEDVDCGECHDEAVDQYTMHGRAEVGVSAYAPKCKDCHGTHQILPSLNKSSQVNSLNLPEMCGQCHEDSTLVDDLDIRFKHPIRVYSESIHGKATVGGMYQAASCTDCHATGGSSHRILPPSDPESTTAHFNISKTCGQCHSAIERDYLEGVHGQLMEQGEVDTPTCTACHGEHSILSTADPRSPVSPNRLAESTCSPCHESAGLNEKYNLETGHLDSFVDSYHGLKSKAGDKLVANCASCHGAHLILPSYDEQSSVNKNNLVKTCGHCHAGITEDIARIPIHETGSNQYTGVAKIVRIIYILLIVGVIGGMILHWLIDLLKKIRDVIRMKPQVRRMEPNEVFQHTILAISFTALVVTGFSLRFYDAWWSQLLFGHEGGYAVRGMIHRSSAVLMIFGSVWHAVFLLTPRGRGFFRDMMPTVADGKQALQRMMFNVGMTDKMPQFGRFSYVEKAEYWALLWGTVVMVITGFALWFDNEIVRFFPHGFLDVMVVIHYYEAWLAMLAILIWHMYATVFNPDVYPMNPSWITGKMPLHMYKEEHPNVIIQEVEQSDPTLTKAPGEEASGQGKLDD